MREIFCDFVIGFAVGCVAAVLVGFIKKERENRRRRREWDE